MLARSHVSLTHPSSLVPAHSVLAVVVIEVKMTVVAAVVVIVDVVAAAAVR